MSKSSAKWQHDRKLAYVYLLHRFFNGSYMKFKNTMQIPDVNEDTIKAWDINHTRGRSDCDIFLGLQICEISK